MQEQKKGAFMGQISKQFMLNEEFKACSIDSPIHSINKKLGLNIPLGGCADLAKALNIPEYKWLILEQSDIFDMLEGEVQILWIKRFYQAIPENADLSGVKEAYFEWCKIAHPEIGECGEKLIELLENCKTF